MSFRKQQIPVRELTFGMYVSKLDRPWTETPFLFQGFYIDSQEVLDKLRRYCNYVYVDVERDEGAIVRPTPEISRQTVLQKFGLGPSKKPASAAAFQRRPENRAGEPAQKAAPIKALKAELGNANRAYTGTRILIQTIGDKLGIGQNVQATVALQAIEPMVESVFRNDDAMSWLARMKRKQTYLYDHALASSVWATIFGNHLGLKKKDVMALAMGALFMDVGKTQVPRELLNKPGPLNHNQMSVVKKHVGCSVNIVSKIVGLDPRVLNAVRFHHERHNGSGYPRGLTGEEIPFFARILGIIDSYDAMITKRPYAEARSTYDAMQELSRCAGTTFDRDLVDQFVQSIGVFPVGSLVELNSGEVGTVVAQNRVRRLRPKIMVLAKSDKRLLRKCPIVDLESYGVKEDSPPTVWIEKGLPHRAYGIDTSLLNL